MKISLITDRQQIADPGAFVPQVARLLNEWGAGVKLLVPDGCYLNLAHMQATADLYLLTSCTPLALSMAGVFHALGATLVNPYPVINALQNRLIGLRTLQAKGLPIPETYATTNLTQLQDLLALGPLLIQHQSDPALDADLPGERIIHHVRELPTPITPHNPLIVQRYLAPLERQWVIYCIGGHLWSVDHTQPGHRGLRKSFALPPAEESWEIAFSGGYRANLAADKATTPSPAELRELTLRCGQAFDLDLFGIKVVQHRGVLYVVDMVSFPDFREAPEAAPRLAEYLYAQAQFALEKKRAPVAATARSKPLPVSMERSLRLPQPNYPSRALSTRSAHLQLH